MNVFHMDGRRTLNNFVRSLDKLQGTNMTEINIISSRAHGVALISFPYLRNSLPYKDLFWM